jgi:DNA recombination protein RmuC
MDSANIILATSVFLSLVACVGVLALLRRRQPSLDVSPLVSRLESIDRAQEKLERALREELLTSRSELSKSNSDSRTEIGNTLQSFRDSTTTTLAEMSRLQHDQLTAFERKLVETTAAHEQRVEALRGLVDEQLTLLRSENAAQLEAMRVTVDEKLQTTLETRLTESFRLVTDQLEAVHRGLGEMQNLAVGVGDLRKVLSNVKARGTWGEVQLGSILEDILTPEQFAANVRTRGEGREMVEYAVRLPGAGNDPEKPVWLPIDSKFPIESYSALVDALDIGDAEGVASARKELESRVRHCARDISEKYVEPPFTTNIGIMFLPTEALFAEVVRNVSLYQELQQKYRVVVAGPTTLASILCAFRMGFHTLAIEKRSSEVWEVLGRTKAEFRKFSGVLEKIGKKLSEASKVVDEASTRTRAIERSLRTVTAPSDAPTAVFDAEAVATLAAGSDVTGTGDAELVS